MTDALGLGLLTLACVGIGLVVVLALGVPSSGGWLPSLVGLAPLAGMLALGGTSVVLMAVGRWTHPVPVVLVALLGALATLPLGRRRAMDVWEPVPGSRRAATVAEVIVLVAFLPLATVVLRLAAASGPGWDGWAIWGLKTQALSITGDLGGPVFVDRFYEGSHQSYPVLYPAIAATGAQSVGGFDPLLADFFGALGVLLGGLAVWAILRTLMPGWIAGAVGLAVAGSGPLVFNATDGYADALLAVIVAVGVLGLLVYVLTWSSVALSLGGGALVVASLVKTEGVVFALAAFLALALSLLVARRSLRPLVIPAMLVVGPAVAWLAWTRGRDDVVDPSELLRPRDLWADRTRTIQAVDALGENLAGSWRPALALALSGVVVALLGRLYAAVVLVAAWATVSLAALALVYTVSRTDINWHLETSADRVVMTVGITALVVGPLLAFAGWREVVGDGPHDAVASTAAHRGRSTRDDLEPARIADAAESGASL